MDDVNAVKALEPVLDYSIRVVGSGIEIFGVVIIVTGIAWSTYRQLRQPISEQDSNVYKIRIGRSLLLGLEVFVAADIIKTVAHELTFLSLACSRGSCSFAPSSAGHSRWKSKVAGRGSVDRRRRGFRAKIVPDSTGTVIDGRWRTAGSSPAGRPPPSGTHAFGRGAAAPPKEFFCMSKI